MSFNRVPRNVVITISMNPDNDKVELLIQESRSSSAAAQYHQEYSFQQMEEAIACVEDKLFKALPDNSYYFEKLSIDIKQVGNKSSIHSYNSSSSLSAADAKTNVDIAIDVLRKRQPQPTERCSII